MQSVPFSFMKGQHVRTTMSSTKMVKILVLFLTFQQCACHLLKVTDRVYFDIESDGKYLGRIVIGLFGEIVPNTVLNFKQIATNGIGGKTYEGGDVIYNNGSGSISIYGKFFKDENFTVKHNGPGIVSMANGGPNTNGCQFFITTMFAPWLDGIHVAFGKVLTGQDVVHKIEHLKTDSNNHPLLDVTIIRSGLLKTKPFYESDEPYELTFWAWIKAGWFPLSFSFAIIGFFHWFMIQLK
ncbi:peptidyl-prolyl cis-trans isomerase-like isoform X2 [Tribolium madens]|uniref:peptidyl-prolyl cis-trans isomerase-like isoform X2 n=1 Tax=Tribolium madens TaxID=41895 RepID=UPI001CF74D6A|nr:peptidyl-prolyl cis-trans isomerase-like isoform X2 [Tribolium madens]